MHLRTSTESLTLRPLSSADSGTLHALMQRNRAHLTRHGDFVDEVGGSPDELAADLGAQPDPPLRFALMLTGELVGRADLVAVKPPQYGVGFWLSEHVTGRGLMRAALEALVSYARDSLDSTDVNNGVTHGNTQSAAVLVRSGFAVARDFAGYTRYHLPLTTVAPSRSTSAHHCGPGPKPGRAV